MTDDVKHLWLIYRSAGFISAYNQKTIMINISIHFLFMIESYIDGIVKYGVNMKSNKVDVLNGSIAKQLMLFFFPILFGSLFQQIYNTTGAIIVGKFIGKYALAAVGGSTASLLNLSTGFAIGVASGGSVIIAQAYGNRDNEKLSKAVHTALSFGVIFGLIISIVMFIFSEKILIFLQVPSEILDDSTTYLRILYVGFVSSLVFNMGSGILRAVGDTKRPLYFLIIAVIVNIILDIVFVTVFHLGVFGVGVSVIIAQTVSALLVLNALINTEFEYKVNIKKMKIDPQILKNILIIGIPAGIQASLFAISNLTVQSSVNYLGADYVAAWTALSKIDSVYWMTIASFGISITTFVAQNFGARKHDRVKDSIKVCITIASIITIIISVVLYTLCPWIYRLFLSDYNVIQIGIKILRMMAPFYITYVAIEIIAGALRGVGDTIIPTVITLVGICALRILWIFIMFGRYPQIETIAICYPISWVATSIIFTLYYLILRPIDKKFAIQSKEFTKVEA
ncbi:MAG: MATE family efflux transporter [Erysipelotrichaceae bacterium]|jgi:putative MATE family efflux protein|nr:MATE family efflux transporter [Erysipelotrichaceae bacterium]